MKLTLNINYRTVWGESLYVTGNTPALGNGNLDAARQLNNDGGETWSTVIELDNLQSDFTYRYFVRHDNGTVKNEWGDGHRYTRGAGLDNQVVYDRWQDQPHDKPYYSSAFTDCICHRELRNDAPVPATGKVTLRVAAPMVKADQCVAVVGSTPQLGEWNPEKAIRLSDHNYPEWEVSIDARALPTGTEYKFLIINTSNGNVVAWEGDNNRKVDVNINPAEATVIAGMRFVNTLAPWRGAGVAIPVFSVRTAADFGVGDFMSLKGMIDWAASTGQTFLQILPINDTTMTHTWTDSYPYNANSTFALHPMYLNLQAMGKLKTKKRRDYYEALAAELNALTEIDYERVNQGKIEYFKEIYKQDGAKTVESADFKKFVKRNESWLKSYAAFCVLRDRFNTADFEMWGEYAAYDKAKIDAFVAENADEINYVYFLQYHLDKQMHEVRDYAHSKGIAIKGDIPIGISRNSVDAWTDARLFNMDCQAGAPPDDFSVLGQNWGFPTYNWEEMSKDGFAWWKARFRKMSEYFDAYRIDHVLGFFRIWQIPMDALHGLLGVFNPALPFTPDELRHNYDFWIDVDLHSKPFIMDWFLGDFFGIYTEEARQRFLTPVDYGRYRLRDEFNTQRKVAAYFADQPKDDKNTQLCNALLGLIDNVLFIEDPYEKGKYHPRISAQFTYIYRSLNDYEKWCFDRLYNDFFYHRHNDFWYGKAMWKMPPLIDATNMLVCAEDLGMIPACVPAVMNQLEILALEIQRMPKDPKVRFGNTWSYPYYSVCTTSTHDMGGIRQWWEEDHAASQAYYNEVLHEHGEAPYYCEPWIANKIVDMHLKSPSMLCILPLQDYLAGDASLRRSDPREEQINVPANPRHYWRYRMHISVEDLQAATQFNNQLTNMIKESGR